MAPGMALRSDDMSPSLPLSSSGKKWELIQADPRKVLSLTQKLGISEVVARILVSRGHDEETAPDFIKPTLRKMLPDPLTLKDMEKAVLSTITALENDEKVAIFADYDVDGATSSALLRRYLYAIGVKARLYIPDRIDEGYGPNADAMKILHAEGVSLVIMVDCGTLAFEPLKVASDLGLKVIVLDHHMSEQTLPSAVAIVNPNRMDENLAHPHLSEVCAAGMSFLFLVALQKGLRERDWFADKQEPDLMQLLDLVALGTVCDVMPLTLLNRAFVSQGLKLIKGRSNPGMTAIMDAASITAVPTAYHLGFIIGPRINAGGRVGEAWLGSKLLTTEDRFKTKDYAQRLHDLNTERQALERNILDEAIAQIEEKNLNDRPVILVASDTWHPGVIGIAASRLKDRFHKPALVLSYMFGDEGKGSGRSIPGVSLGELMHKAVNAGLIRQGGGHAMAAGFSVMRQEFDTFYDFLTQESASQVAAFIPKLVLEGYLSLGGITEALAEDLGVLEPYGQGNPSPKFVIGPVDIVSTTVFGEDHLRLVVKDSQGVTVKAVMFRGLSFPGAEALLTLPKGVHLAGSIKMDTYQHRRSVNFIVDDFLL